MAKSKFAPAKCIAIDVDGTLLKRGKINWPLANWAKQKKLEGFEVILWTARGRPHAAAVVERFGLQDHFSAIIGKPGYIVDDMGWGWTKFTKIVTKFL